jgi:hypothetical protein
MTTKKFKTVAGYLRSENDRLHYKIPQGASPDERIAAAEKRQRVIINQLLPQLELPKLDDNETPSDGVKRLIAIGGSERQLKALRDCERWLKNYIIVIGSSLVPSADSEPKGGPYRHYQSGHVGVTTQDGDE